MLFFNVTATTEIYTLSLHDALPIFRAGAQTDLDNLGIAKNAREEKLRARDQSAKANDDPRYHDEMAKLYRQHVLKEQPTDRKSTRLNSSHGYISYAVFCLKKKRPEK